MPTAPATSGTSALAVDERFLDLICHDQELLDAEFDAIIAAEWPDPPAHGPGHGAAGGGHPVRGAARHRTNPVRGPVSRPRHPGVGGWARQRSPPFGRPTDNGQEGR